MSDERSESGAEQNASAEPVDAEFEPAPDHHAPQARPSSGKRKGAGPVRLTLFVIASALIGGAAGYGTAYLLSETGLDPAAGASAALDERIATLEAARSGSDAGAQALQARLESLEQDLNANPLRTDGFEQLVRDVADLRDRVAALETARADAGAQTEARPGGEGVDTSELTALEDRFEGELEALAQRLATALEAASTAQASADEVRASLTQLLSAGGPSAEPSPSADSGVDPARITALQNSIQALETAQSQLSEALERLSGLAPRVSALEDSAPGADAFEQLNGRIAALRRSVDALEQATHVAASGTDTAQTLASRALAFASVSEAASRAAPFAVELAALARVWPDAPELDRLTPVARSGAPTLEALTSRFPGEALREATGAAQTYFGVLRLQRQGADGPAGEIEARLGDNDLQGALDIVAALEGDAALSVEAWRADAVARRTIEMTLAAMNQALNAEGETP